MWDQGINSVTTDKNGNYDLREAYPVTKWSILEAFNTRYHTTGITVQADNETSPTTYLGAAVDLNVLPIIGLGGRVDWGVKPFSGRENGGIAGTVTYDTTRNELDPADAVTEPYQPGIPDMTVHLYYPLRDANGDLVTNADGSVAVVKDADGNPLKVQDDYTSETWEAPQGLHRAGLQGRPAGDRQGPAGAAAGRRLAVPVRRGADDRVAGHPVRHDRRATSARPSTATTPSPT